MGLVAGDRIAVLTSGGDAPGMNAALRAVARVGASLGLDVLGIEDGYAGLIEGRTRALDARALDEASRRGGTWLGTARSRAFMTPEGLAQAESTLMRERVRGLVVIGGNGSLAGALTIKGEVAGRPIAVAGVPASIDNDLAATSMAIGVDTAVNTIVEACDRIFDTASSHHRTFIVEVMGRDCGYLAMASGIAVGADCVLVPEVGRSPAAIVAQVLGAMERAYREAGKRRVVVVKSEGVHLDPYRLKAELDARVAAELPQVDTRVTVLGHTVRGGTPSAFDRLLASRLAHSAVLGLKEGEAGFMAGWSGPGVTGTPSRFDPYVAHTPLDEVLRETAALTSGTSALARWRRRVFDGIDQVLER